MIRTMPVEVGTKPYDWNTQYVYQCTWFVYFRCAEESLPFPCWYEGQGDKGFGAYTDAKYWLMNYRSPWEVKGPDYTPKAHDVIVYDGEFGHVQFMETDTMFSEYRSGDINSFRTGRFEKKNGLLGFLHCPYEPVETVERNVNVDQVQTTDDTLRIRLKPSLSADIVGYVNIGYYNILSTKKADNYTWYKIAADRWIADVSTIYLPKNEEDDIIKQIEEYLNKTKQKVNELTNERDDYKLRLDKIKEIANYGTGNS